MAADSLKTIRAHVAEFPGHRVDMEGVCMTVEIDDGAVRTIEEQGN